MKIVSVFILLVFLSPMFSQTTRVMTFNIRYDNKGDGENTWENRKEELAGMINYYHPDIFGLQEALPGQLHYLNRQMSDYLMFALGREPDNTGEATPIFYNPTRYELIENKTFWLSDYPDSISKGWDAALPRICTYGVFREKRNGEKLYVFNCHFDHIGKIARPMSAKLILKKIAEITEENDRVIFMGDLNSEPGSETVKILKSELNDGLSSADCKLYGPNGTFSGFDKSISIEKKIDYIFVRNFKVLKYRHVDDKMKNNNFLSDHYPVLIELLSVDDKTEKKTSGNPIFEGWYADPEGVVLGNGYWIFPTYSDEYDKQVFFDAFSSSDMLHWEKHANVLDTSGVKWAKRALWAPAIVEKEKKYFLFFSANDIQKPGGPYWDENNSANKAGGIGVAVADSPSGPYKDYLGKPLISDFYNGAQPIDQFVFKDSDETYYMFYGGWGHCNIGKLSKDFKGFIPWNKKNLFREITPEGYVEGPFMFKRNNIYYFMWSEGGWGNDTYKVAYGMSKKVTGPFKKVGTILESDKNIATGAGHNSVINVPGSDNWFIVYHRRPIPNKGRDHRVTCIDKLEFNADGTIKPVVMTREGVSENKIDN